MRPPNQRHRRHPLPGHEVEPKTWFRAAYLILTSKKGTSGPRLADRLGVTEKTAHRLRMKLTKALQTRLDRDLRGLLEVDESYVGGIDHGEDGRGTDKAVVQGWAENRLDHAGRLRLFHRSDASKESLTGDARDVVDRDSAMVHSDGWAGYRFEDLPHHKEIVGDDRAAHEVFPHVHIAFSNLSRLVEGVHTHVSEAKLQGYLDLFSYRFNHRERLWEGFLKALRGLVYGEPWAWGEIAGARLGPAA